MKKSVFLSFAAFLGLNAASAQLTVLENGNVGIGNNNPQSVLTIGSNIDSLFTATITDGYVGLSVKATKPMPYNAGYWGMGIESIKEIYRYKYSMRGDIAIIGHAISKDPLPCGRAVGVLGRAANATSGYNYGVIGAITGNNNGTGVLGQADGEYLGKPIPGVYAGYFLGNVRVTGNLTATVTNESDIRFKQNVVELGGISAQLQNHTAGQLAPKSILDQVVDLRPVQYNYKQVLFETETAGDTATAPTAYFDEQASMFQRKHYGLIAQEVQELYPDLVYEDDNGYLSIDYIGLIPLLIQSVKELDAKIETMNSLGTGLSKSTPRTTAGASDVDGVPAAKPAALYQNTPNPFSQATSIKYYLPESTTTASLCIYDMQGKQLQQIALTQRGEGAEQISASQLDPGMYLYALIADGQEVDVKRMILTE